jgi:hypothetical protein
LRNDAPADNHWIKIKLIGTKSNRSAIGARFVIRYGNKIQAQQLLSQSSYLSANDPRLHFGLGDEKKSTLPFTGRTVSKNTSTTLLPTYDSGRLRNREPSGFRLR